MNKAKVSRFPFNFNIFCSEYRFLACCQVPLVRNEKKGSEKRNIEENPQHHFQTGKNKPGILLKSRIRKKYRSENSEEYSNSWISF